MTNLHVPLGGDSLQLDIVFCSVTNKYREPIRSQCFINNPNGSLCMWKASQNIVLYIKQRFSLGRKLDLIVGVSLVLKKVI